MVTTQNPTALTDLPLELLWMIPEHLPPVDLTCLALVNHHLRSSFARAAFQNFSTGRTGNPSDDPRIKLLSRLSCDLPQYHLCFICLRLHLWKSTKLPSYSYTNANHCSNTLDMKDRYLPRPLPLCHYPSYAHYKFHFVHLQLAMRRFYYEPGFGIPVESLLYTEIGASRLTSKARPWLQSPVNNISEEDPLKNVMRTLFSAEARICSVPPSLCLRTQEIAVVIRQNVPRMWPCRENGPMVICKHIHTHDAGFVHIFTSHIESYCSSTGINKPADQGSCEKCNTSWKLEMRTLDENHASLTLTRWMDLGPGLTPDDAQWRYRLDNELLINSANHEIVDPHLRFERDSIQAGSSNALSEDTMYYRNVSLLQGRTYQTVMTPVHGGIYVLHGEAKRSSSRCIIL